MTTRRKSAPDTETVPLDHTEETTTVTPAPEHPIEELGESHQEPHQEPHQETPQENHPEASSEEPPVKEATVAPRPPALAKRLPSKNTPKFSLKIR
jgi:hypothetical protein